MKEFGDPLAASSCSEISGALVFRIDLRSVKKVEGHAFEIPFPDNVMADESGEDKRSTLQLFAVTSSGATGTGALKPMGPPHALHKEIAKKGNGAYSHWRQTITSGPYTSSYLRFSTPGNQPPEKLTGLVAVVYPMAPPMGWIEFAGGEKKNHQELFRELFLLTFPTVGVEPQLVERPEETRNGTYYVWRVGGNREFVLPLKDGELYEKRLPYQIHEYYNQFERKGGLLYPPPESYIYYQNKVGLARLFQKSRVKTPETWIFSNLKEALGAKSQISFPVVIKDPYGFSSLGIQQAADWEEFKVNIKKFFDAALAGVEALVQKKVVALREARITYVDGKPFHGYWRIRQSLKSATAASNFGGYQDFSFPLNEIAPYVAEFAKMTGVPVGGVDFIWQEAEPDVKSTPFTLEVSPTSDINPPAPASWKSTYAEFKHTSGFHDMYLGVRRKWTEQMAMAVISQYRRTKRHLFVDIDNVVALSAARVLRWKGKPESYSAREVMKDGVVPDAVEALDELSESYFIRFLTARGQYEDCFNVTQTWLDQKGFRYDELIVVPDAVSKIAHMSLSTLLVDDFTVGHEEEVPKRNDKFMQQLRDAGLPFILFPFGGSWADVLPQLREEARRSATS
eukprot:CAMPEP_0171217592 /NCGR_PEP_ID=MMETSP0790-20130122/32767_1 /TAXON_ID=2925 /ORGANISM="Alexandrium catenella, Strain OF101" /LENGTH=623 /DNA_ID=CAMNT_0011683391 /DNA_START=27 /DNA_END=1898 /DNA_ORIENTATION=-